MASTKESEADGSTAVTILGRTYRLRGDGDAAYLQELAALVDEKMREVESATGTADTLKIAILASLNLADDYMKISRGSGARTAKALGVESNRRLARLVNVLDEALEL
jgi:cell division protein ZapA